mgnify:CR=1 FL=1
MSSEEGNAVAKDRRALDALYRVSSLAGNSEDPEIALEGIIDEVVRTFNAGSASIALIKPGVSTDKVAAVWPTAQELGFNSELEAFGLQFGHGLGLALHERPIISRAVSMENPMEIKTGMVFALETYCPASDGYSAARIEEEVVVTDTGCKVISLFPAEELPIANRY